MTDGLSMEGRCLCGEVRLSAVATAPRVAACHCGICRRWSGTFFAAFEAETGTVRVEGPVRTYRSSSFAERAWCDACGTQLWLKDDTGPHEFFPALFEAAADFPLASEIYIERRLACLPLAGDHPRRTGAEYEANHLHVTEGIPT